MRVAIVVLCWGLTLTIPGTALGAGRLGRHISDIPGMPSGMTDVGQDTTGYLWISSTEGLHRYDGFEVRRWDPEVTTGRLVYVSTGPDNRVLSGDRGAGLFEVRGARLSRLESPAGASDPGARDAVYDGNGVLWAAWDGRLLRREGETWVDVGGSRVTSESAFRLASRDDGGVHLGTADGTIWTFGPDGDARRIADGLGGRVEWIVDDPDGAAAVVRFGPRPGVIRVGADGVDYLLDYSERCEGLARRGSTLWVSYATGVWAVHDDGTREFLSTTEGFTGGGCIAVDRDGGLWVASVKGLSHYPQPDTRLWTELSGLPRIYLREIHRVPGGYMLMSWRGPMLIDERGDGVADADLGNLFVRDMGCADSWGGVWMKAAAAPPPEEVDNYYPDEAMIVEWREGRPHVRTTGPSYHGDLECDKGPDGSLWILANGEVLQVKRPGGELTLRARLRHGDRWQKGLVLRRDEGSVLIAFQSGEVCDAPLSSDGAPVEDDAWSCTKVEGADTVTGMVVTPWGRPWLSAANGLFERTEGAWRRVPGELADLPSVLGVEPSPSGGVWVLGWRERWRVEEIAAGEPPVVIERLGTAHGIPAWQNARRLLEEQDGTIWIPLFSGLVRVPPEVRRIDPGAPRVTLTHLVADGRSVDAGGSLELRHGDHSLEIRWSALSFRDPSQVRYRMRLDSAPEWTVLSQPFVRLSGLSSGSHRVELGASLDGRTWSDEPAGLDFSVRRAWYLQSWFVGLVVVGVAAATYFGYRLRLAHLLRLERQRTRIAMDLHDEMGAGLGSAGLLVGLLEELDLDDDERRRIGHRATEQIRDLGGSLSNIVWSLRPGTETLDALLLFLRQRTSDLFPPGGGTRATVDAPDPCPLLKLGLPLRRNLQWIAVEALHNTARHAEASRVVMKLRPDGEDWVLSIRDDGKGCVGEETEGQGSGLGQESMRRRAREIGADLLVRSAPGEGTEVSIRFRPGRRK